MSLLDPRVNYVMPRPPIDEFFKKLRDAVSDELAREIERVLTEHLAHDYEIRHHKVPHMPYVAHIEVVCHECRTAQPFVVTLELK